MSKQFKLQCKSLALPREPFVIDKPGKWLVLSDIHIPYHDEKALTTAVQWGIDNKATDLLLNGDIMDCALISTYTAEKGAVDLIDEIDMTRGFLEQMRQVFPKGRIIYKTGNHEDRLHHYLARNAGQAARLRYVDLGSQLGFDDLKIELVDDKRHIQMGALNVYHGHEFSGGGGVNPARWLYTKMGDCGLMGHLHRTSSHKEPRARGYVSSTYSAGCLCDLNPAYAACNKWDHGFAVVNLYGRGDFHCQPLEVLGSGKVR